MSQESEFSKMSLNDFFEELSRLRKIILLGLGLEELDQDNSYHLFSIDPTVEVYERTLKALLERLLAVMRLRYDEPNPNRQRVENMLYTIETKFEHISNVLNDEEKSSPLALGQVVVEPVKAPLADEKLPEGPKRNERNIIT